MDGMPRTFWTGPNLPCGFQKQRPPLSECVSGAPVKYKGRASTFNKVMAYVSLSLFSSSTFFLKGKSKFVWKYMEVQSCQYKNEISCMHAVWKSSEFPPGDECGQSPLYYAVGNHGVSIINFLVKTSEIAALARNNSSVIMSSDPTK